MEFALLRFDFRILNEFVSDFIQHRFSFKKKLNYALLNRLDLSGIANDGFPEKLLSKQSYSHD